MSVSLLARSLRGSLIQASSHGCEGGSGSRRGHSWLAIPARPRWQPCEQIGSSRECGSRRVPSRGSSVVPPCQLDETVAADTRGNVRYVDREVGPGALSVVRARGDFQVSRGMPLRNRPLPARAVRPAVRPIFRGRKRHASSAYGEVTWKRDGFVPRVDWSTDCARSLASRQPGQANRRGVLPLGGGPIRLGLTEAAVALRSRCAQRKLAGPTCPILPAWSLNAARARRHRQVDKPGQSDKPTGPFMMGRGRGLDGGVCVPVGRRWLVVFEPKSPIAGAAR